MPNHLPIIAAKMAAGSYEPVYRERELTESVLLCDEQGNLNLNSKHNTLPCEGTVTVGDQKLQMHPDPSRRATT